MKGTVVEDKMPGSPAKQTKPADLSGSDVQDKCLESAYQMEAQISYFN